MPLINEKYYKGHSWSGKSKIKDLGMLRVGKVRRAVCWCVGSSAWDEGTGGRWGVGYFTGGCCSGGKDRCPTTLWLRLLFVIVPYPKVSYWGRKPDIFITYLWPAVEINVSYTFGNPVTNTTGFVMLSLNSVIIYLLRMYWQFIDIAIQIKFLSN